MKKKMKVKLLLEPRPFIQTYFHGTRANLKLGDFIITGMKQNHGQNGPAKYVYLTATLDAAIWGAELAVGSGSERIYLVEPTGELEVDPNFTDELFRENPTLSYRSKEPLRVVGEVTSWKGHSKKKIKAMLKSLEHLKALGIEVNEQ